MDADSREKKPADPDDILERLRQIQISQRQFENKADLPRNFISRAKSGDYRGPGSEKHWTQALVLLEELEQKSKRAGPKPAGNPSGVVPAELLDAIRNLSSEEDALSLQRMLIEYAARGLISNAFLKNGNESLSRFQQLTRQKREADLAQQLGEPVRVIVEYVGNWRGAGE